MPARCPAQPPVVGPGLGAIMVAATFLTALFALARSGAIWVLAHAQGDGQRGILGGVEGPGAGGASGPVLLDPPGTGARSRG